MNRFAYRTTGLAIKTLYHLSKADMVLDGQDHIPSGGSIIFVINHFTRIETVLMPYLIARETKRAVWSLADESLFVGPLGDFLESVGAVSTKDPQRDQLIVKTLLTGEAHWIIFPEGRMVKSLKVIEKGRYMVSYAGGKHPPHTGAATLALRTEFYRRRLIELERQDAAEADRLLREFKIPSMEALSRGPTYIVPVNITYYPIRAQENILSKLAVMLGGQDIPDRVVEEIMTEGAMLLSGVDIDIRFAPPIDIGPYLTCKTIGEDICRRGSFGFDTMIPSRRQMRRASLKIMKHYLDSIYSMTTVNSDHLFAAMVRQMPYRYTDEMDLKRRVFLITQDITTHPSIRLHRNLRDNQLHLLTDDRFHRFRDFLSVAVGKGVLVKKKGALYRDTGKLFSPFDFHRVRIDNPVAVMANAIEPLQGLQKSIRRVAWMPSGFIRRRVVKTLLKAEMAAFLSDHTAFFSEGETKDKKIGCPFFLPGKSFRKLGKTGVLLIHGYLAAPAEVRGLARHLAACGHPVYAPRLKGHGTSPDDLATRTYQDWIKSIDAGYAVIRSYCERIVVGGFSTGAGLALELAARIPDIDGVFAVCPPMRLQDLSAKFVPAVAAWNRLLQKLQVSGGRKLFVDNKPEHPHINYHRNPVSGVRELERLMHALEPKLTAVRVPALVIQADRDPVVDPRGSRRVFEQLGSATKTYSLMNFSRHGILIGDGSEKVYQAISCFIGQL